MNTTPEWATGSTTYAAYLEASALCADVFAAPAAGGITAETIQLKTRRGRGYDKRILRVVGTITRTGTSPIPGSRTITVDAGGQELTAHLDVTPDLSTIDYPGGPMANPIADAQTGQRVAFAVSDHQHPNAGSYSGYRLAETFSVLNSH